MNLFVDTSVWSLALRRDTVPGDPAVLRLRDALETGEGVFTTGLVLQELLQGLSGPRDRGAIISHFEPLPLLMPDREDHVAAAEGRNLCRRKGLQVGTIDVLLAQLCMRHDLVMLTTDRDYQHMAHHLPLDIWGR